MLYKLNVHLLFFEHRLERELEELETGVSATSTKENLSDAVQEVNIKTVEKTVRLTGSSF